MNLSIKHHPYNRPLLFFLLFVVLFGMFHWIEILQLEPQGMHVWRQTDALSTVQNYHYDHHDFLKPATGDYRYLQQDVALTEFPIFYYLTAKIWYFTGESPFVLRFLNLLVFISGLFALYRLSGFFTSSLPLKLVCALMPLFSPAIAHYAPNLLPNTPALGLLFVSWYFYYRSYDDDQNWKPFLWASFFLTLAMLLKITMLSTWGFVFWFMVVKAIQLRSYSWFFKRLLVHFLVLVPLILWISYLQAYNQESASESLFQVFSIYTHSWEQIAGQFVLMKANLLQLESKWGWFLGFFCTGFVLYNAFRKKHWKLLFLLFMSAISTLIYISLFWMSFSVHDYYLLDLMPLMLLLHFSAIYYLKDVQFKGFDRVVVLLLGLLLLRSSADVTVRNLESSSGFKKIQRKLAAKDFVGLQDWFRWDSSSLIHLKKYRQLLLKQGINRTTKVFCFPDQSPNTILYYFNLRGSGNFAHGTDYASMNPIFKEAYQKGYRYLIWVKRPGFEMPTFSEQQFDLVHDDQNIRIYRLKKV